MSANKVTKYTEALAAVESDYRSLLLPRRITRHFITEWIYAKNSKAKNPDKEALRWTKEEYGNPLLWLAISFVLQNIILPLLKKWWENRNKDGG